MRPIPVLYDPRQTCLDAHEMSPSARKPALVVEAWIESGLPVEVRGFEPVAPADFEAVHDSVYVQGILSGTIRNGFGTFSKAIAASLPWTSGSLLAACRAALSEGGAACSPTSGFHHAEPAQAMGFCTFNGLMVAASKMISDGSCARLSILDLDQHYGNGTEAILASRPDLRPYVRHWTFGSLTETEPAWFPARAEEWLSDLPDLVEGILEGADLLIFQAGADPHLDDPLGGSLSSEQMRRRDAIVFDACARSGVPVAWNLAGGYRNPVAAVLESHVATMRECVRAFGSRPQG